MITRRLIGIEDHQAVREEFAIRRVREDGRGTLILTGRLDLASAPTLEELMVELCVDGAQEVVLDIGELTYLDSTGLRTLYHGRVLCTGYGCGFRLLPVTHGARESCFGERRSGRKRRRRSSTSLALVARPEASVSQR
jgi:anti-anti-sigma factor